MVSPTMSNANRLYFGDCLEVMRQDIPSESVDLIYLDPPFNSKRLYNAFMEGAQFLAFDDTWQWHEAIDDFDELAAKPAYADLMEGLRRMLGEGSQLAYLSYMANRLVECRRVLKPTGSIYLHCDPTMSHYLKAVMDGIFGARNFKNEIIWKRANTVKGNFGQSSKFFGPNTDTILFYSANTDFDARVFHQPFRPYTEEAIKSYSHVEAGTGRRYRLVSMTGPGGAAKGNPSYEVMGVTRYWRYSKKRMQDLIRQGLVVQTSPGTVPRRKYYLDEGRGVAIQSLWDDISALAPTSKERRGYPTQKPLKLLERIIQANSNEGDVVLDPFCGCGTTIHAAQNLSRRWIGIDICVNACKEIERRMRSHFDSLWSNVEFIGFPTTREDARTLASLDKFRFERWAVSLVDGMEPNTRQRGDKGIDGRGRIALRKGQFIDIVSQAKGGGTGPGDVQALNGARLQAKADLGIFTCFEDRVTRRMKEAAVNCGRFMETPIIQIYTIEDFFEGRRPSMPIPA